MAQGLIADHNYSWKATVITTPTLALATTYVEPRFDFVISVKQCLSNLMAPSPAGPENFVYLLDGVLMT